MKPDLKRKYKNKEKIIKAMAHATRLFIIDELNNGEKCVCELVDLIGDDQSTISKHLSVLASSGIVVAERRKSNIYYSLRCPCVISYIKCVEKVIEKNATDKWV